MKTTELEQAVAPLDGAVDTPQPISGERANIAARVGRYRWVICALLFTAATVNYVDRQVIGILKTTLQGELKFNEVTYGNVVTAFQAAYAIGMVMMGWFMDRIGTRRGFTTAVGFWSLAAAGHALATSAFGLGIARFALGIGEAGLFPGAVKTVAEWFPKKERALATGLFNAGTNIGAIVCPLVVPWLAGKWGWQAAFIVTGAVGSLWILAWLKFYAPMMAHPRVSASERAYILSDPVQRVERVPWATLLPHRQTWAFAIAKFLTDPFWWLYLFWLPDYFNRNHGVNMARIGLPLVAIYLLSDVGSIFGGWLSSTLLRRGWSTNAARKTAMIVCALGVTPLFLATRTESLWVAVILIGLATASHQGFSANLFTLTSDMFPSQAVGSAVGLGGMAGAIGGMFVAQLAGHLLQLTGSYVVLFILAGSAYLLAVAVIHLLVPKLAPAKLSLPPSMKR